MSLGDRDYMRDGYTPRRRNTRPVIVDRNPPWERAGSSRGGGSGAPVVSKVTAGIERRLDLGPSLLQRIAVICTAVGVLAGVICGVAWAMNAL